MTQIPWTMAMHAQMHWRPDAITRTGVVQPMWVRQVSPVDMARHTIDPFIASVRGRGPAVSPYPTPEDVAYAAGKLAQLFARGKTGVVCMGNEKIQVGPGTPASGGIVGTIVQAAQELARGGTVTIQVGSRAVVVCNSGRGGEPQVAPAPAAPAAGTMNVRPEQQAATTPSPAAPSASTSATSAPVPAASASAASVNVRNEQRPTPPASAQAMQHAAMQSALKRGGWGEGPPMTAPPMFAPTRLPQIPGPGSVPQYPFLDYAAYYRNINYDNNVWNERNYRASLAARFAPQAINAMNAANSVPIYNAQRQVAPALAARPLMTRQRYPEPSRVFPSQAATSINTRKEQR